MAEQFLDESASQLTYHGICELNAVMEEGQLAVLFRNNHFSTMVKQGGVLYLLVTDQGFLHQGDVVWESLDSVQGDTVFVDQQFNIVQNQGNFQRCQVKQLKNWKFLGENIVDRGVKTITY